MTSTTNQPAEPEPTTPAQEKDPVTGTTGNETGEKQAAENEDLDPVG